MFKLLLDYTIHCMLKFTFIKNYAKNMLFLTIYNFQFCLLIAPPRDAAIVYVTEYTSSKVIMTF